MWASCEASGSLLNDAKRATKLWEGTLLRQQAAAAARSATSWLEYIEMMRLGAAGHECVHGIYKRACLASGGPPPAGDTGGARRAVCFAFCF